MYDLAVCYIIRWLFMSCDYNYNNMNNQKCPCDMYKENRYPCCFGYSQQCHTCNACCPQRAFGSLMTSAGSIQLNTTPTKVIMTEQSQASMGIDYSYANAIRIKNTGIYRIDILVVGNSVVNENVSVRLNINGVTSEYILQTLNLTSISVATFAITNFVTLSAGDILALEMVASDSMTFYFPSEGPGAILSVRQVA